MPVQNASPCRFRGAWWKLPAAGLLLASAAALFYAWDPAQSGFFPPCVFHLATGLSCPGCGTQRALHQLLHGHLAAAFFLNPLAVLLLPAVGGWLAWKLGCALAGRRWQFALPAAWIWAILMVIVLYGVLRNLPFYPFTLFAG